MMSWLSVCTVIAFLSIPLAMAKEQTFGALSGEVMEGVLIHNHRRTAYRTDDDDDDTCVCRCRSVPCCCQCFVDFDPKACCCRTGSNQNSNDDSFERGRRFRRQIIGERHGLSCACPIPAPRTTTRRPNTTPLPCCIGLQDFQAKLVVGSQCRPCDEPELPCCRGNTNTLAKRLPGSQCRQCDDSNDY
ncbi:hypothetical protein Ddc_16261 [Ditylenchus destructor]|nr:hypothetical protein Ddc_16261 [Ditylenchus destructor]